MIHPDTQRFMAQRMGGDGAFAQCDHTPLRNASHLVVDVIESAVGAAH